MKLRNVQLILFRELRDQLRDRRTLFMMIVLPILLYPSIGIGISYMTTMFRTQPREIVVLGHQFLPERSKLIESGRIAPRFFDSAAQADQLRLILEDPDSGVTLGETHRAQLDQARELVALIKKKQALDNWEDSRSERPLSRELNALEAEISERFIRFKGAAIVAIPEGFDDFVEDYIERAPPRDEGSIPPERPLVIYNSADEGSKTSYELLAEVFAQWERELMKLRQVEQEIPSPFMMPIFERRVHDGSRRNVEDVAREVHRSANVWSRFFPTLLILMTLTGAFYPAVDLGAGEKERGTMETLLISPAARSEIVIGKFLTILVFSITTAFFNLISMGLTGFYMISMANRAALSQMGDLTLPPFGSFLLMGMLTIPLAALFSAMSLSLAIFAKSTKEGQYYLTPLMVVVMGLTIFCMSPGIELTPFNSVLPVVGLGLLLKSLILSPLSEINVYGYLLPVMLTSIGYGLLALWWAIEQFHREEVLFRESEEFDLKLWIKHLLREKEPLPTVGEVVFCFVLILLLQFFSAGTFQAMLSGPESERSSAILNSLMLQQVVIIASPALFMGVLLTSDFRKTFRLRIPSAKFLLSAAVLPLFLLPLAMELQAALKGFFPPLPDTVRQQLGALADSNISLWVLLLTFAVLPAICEELTFRGLILSGFARGNRTNVAIVFSSVLFGFLHMIPQQVLNAFLLGLVLGLLAIRSGSLLPGILFHLVNNGSTVMLQHHIETFESPGWWSALISITADQPRFTWLTLAIGVIGAVTLLSLLIRGENEIAPGLDAEQGPAR
jgi:sodium transport system permease protein